LKSVGTKLRDDEYRALVDWADPPGSKLSLAPPRSYRQLRNSLGSPPA
jgi:hypothetical protein